MCATKLKRIVLIGEIRVSEVRVSEVRVSEVRVSEVRVSEVSWTPFLGQKVDLDKCFPS
jgi:hypothetical protein